MRIDPKSGATVSDEGVAVQDTSPTQAAGTASSSKQSAMGSVNTVESWQPTAEACINKPSSDCHGPADLSCMVGDVGYYRARYDDFAKRHPDQKPPDYYLEYGEKYARRFSQETYGKLSPEGQRWLKDTFRLLQQSIEHLRENDPKRFDELERDPEAFMKFAYDSHPRAYLDGGLADVPVADLVQIGMTPDLGDLGTADGQKQVLATAEGLAGAYWAQAQRKGPDLLDSAERDEVFRMARKAMAGEK